MAQRHTFSFLRIWKKPAKKLSFAGLSVQIVIDLCGIVAVDTDRRIVKRGQQVLPDIADLGGVLFEAVKDKSDMLRVELQKPGLHDLSWDCLLYTSKVVAGVGIDVIEKCGTFVSTGVEVGTELGFFNFAADRNCTGLVDRFSGVVARDLHNLRIAVDALVDDHQIALRSAIREHRRGVHGNVNHPSQMCIRDSSR